MSLVGIGAISANRSHSRRGAGESCTGTGVGLRCSLGTRTSGSGVCPFPPLQLCDWLRECGLLPGGPRLLSRLPFGGSDS